MDHFQEKAKARTRRAMNRRHDRRRKDIIHRHLSRFFISPAGYMDWIMVNGHRQFVGKYVKYRRDSRAQQYWKRHSNKVIRRSNEVCQGGAYRKCFDYWWTLY